ncbi:MAG: N-formylglutamate amidohydrolase [Candidatus Cloacimonetes bacterium]|nr:N-formylglutamate amidohydrolase [Candidatus Cloacimonadota bacterium]
MIANYYFRFDLPLVCTAIHNGHEMSPDWQANLAITNKNRSREEDQHTGFFTEFCNNRIIGRYTRFECDLNRHPRKTIYLKPKDAWGLTVRKEPPTPEMVRAAKAKYQMFYRRTGRMLREMERTFGRFLLLDLHSYNHRRKGADGEIANQEKNPEIIIGTSTMPENRMPLAEILQDKITSYDFYGGSIDARINVKFPGGHFSRWVISHFPDAIVFAIEFKKIWMDEWTGKVDKEKQTKMREALELAVPELLKTMNDKAYD